MDRTIDIFIKGSYLQKNNNIGGIQGEGNVTTLHITFDDSWANLAKSITFWNAKGENPVKVLLTNAQLVEIRNSLLEFNVLIPAEPLAVEGDMIFVIDGYVDGKRARSMQDSLVVKAAMTTNEPIEPTPTQAEQLNLAIQKILPEVQKETIKATEAAKQSEASAQKSATSALEASNSAESAKQSAVSAETAHQGAVAAQKKAETAQLNAEAAQDKAETAQRGAETAKAGAETAQQKAETARLGAETAQKNAETAQTKAEAAQQKAETARTATQKLKDDTTLLVQQANTAKDEAQTAVNNAKAEVAEAHKQAVSSASSAAQSANSATLAGQKATESANSALLSKSYAVGGTGQRPGEELDNAKYYAEQAKQIVGGDFVTNVKLEETIAPITKSIGDINTDLTAKGKAIEANTTEISNVSKKVTENATAIQNVAKSVPTAQKQAEWDGKVKSVNGKTGTAITLGAADVGAVSSVNNKSGTSITLTAADVGAVAEADRNVIVDDVTGKKYKLGIQNGGLYYREVL
jgi:hypothetical protein|nr:MAG TPA: hypothetical protein [Caudoviricetes sp.]